MKDNYALREQNQQIPWIFQNTSIIIIYRGVMYHKKQSFVTRPVQTLNLL